VLAQRRPRTRLLIGVTIGALVAGVVILAAAFNSLTSDRSEPAAAVGSAAPDAAVSQPASTVGTDVDPLRFEPAKPALREIPLSPDGDTANSGGAAAGSGGDVGALAPPAPPARPAASEAAAPAEAALPSAPDAVAPAMLPIPDGAPALAAPEAMAPAAPTANAPASPAAKGTGQPATDKDFIGLIERALADSKGGPDAAPVDTPATGAAAPGHAPAADGMGFSDESGPVPPESIPDVPDAGGVQ
jgi:hypothetical protein